MMAHMHDLRLWTIAYGAGNKNNLQRLQELHRLNNEMWYNVSESIWKRLLVMVALWFFFTKIAKRKYMNQGMFDSHDASLRDTTAHT
jgi:hypothetical protein